MLRNLRDAWSWIEKLVRRVERVESGAMLENSSITNGRMRFIGGLLRIDSGGQIQVIGEWRLTGTGAITGDVVAEGKWTQNGAWEFNGPGDIAGDVDITGDLRILPGGMIEVGDMIIDPANGGSMTFPGGAAIRAGAGGGITVVHGNGSVSVITGNSSLISNGKGFEVDGFYAGPRIRGMPTIASAAAGDLPAGAVWVNGDGVLFRVIL